MPARSPPPTPVSSPRVSPTPPGSPKQVSAPEEKPSSELGLSPSSIPLRPVQHVSDATPLSDDMDIDDDLPSDVSLSAHQTTNGQDHIASGASSDGEADWSPEDWMADIRRVKVYELIGSQWTDRGTALCTGVYDEELDQASIVAKSELNDVELLRSEIRASDVYSRQQDTLIVWTEPDGKDYALSFQDTEGCAEIWDFISEVQRHFRDGDDSSSSPLASGSGQNQSRLTVAAIVASGRLPDPTLGIIGDIDLAIKILAKTVHGRERICEYILNDEYIKSLIDVMEQAEDLESLSDLHALYGLMHTILAMNDHGIYDYILHEDIFIGVVGILEYDPEFPTFKASYRDFIKNSSEYLQVLEIKDESIQRKIHQTYRLQYLKDLVLARVLDDSTFNVLNSFIIFNQIDIINHIVQDHTFLNDLLRPFVSFNVPEPSSRSTPPNTISLNGNGASRAQAPSPPSTPFVSAVDTTKSKADIVRFVHQLCLMGKNVQIPTRLALYRALVDRGLLWAIEWAFRQPSLPSTANDDTKKIGNSVDVALLDTAAEVLIVVVDHHVSGVRTHIVRQHEASKSKEQEAELRRAASGLGVVTNTKTNGTSHPTDENPNLLKALMMRLGGTKEIPFRNQVGDSLRMLLELPNLELHAAPPDKSPSLQKMREDPVNELFFPIFYDRSTINVLFKPLIDIQEWKTFSEPVLKLNREQSSLFLYLCDLLCTFFVQHSHRSQYFVLSTNISAHIATLLRSREKHIRLAALRFFRVSIRISNQFVIRHLIKHDVFSAVLDLTEREASRDNLISASCQEFFEHIRKDNIRLAMTHIMETNEARVRALADRDIVGPRFKAFIIKWEQITAPAPKLDAPGNENAKEADRRKWGQGTSLDAEEESYFNGDDDDDDGSLNVGAWTNPQNLKRKRPGSRGSPASPSGSGNNQFRVVSTVRRLPNSFNSAGSSSSTTSPIAVPQPYPMRISLVDYDDNDDDPSTPVEEPVPSTSSPSSPSSPSNAHSPSRKRSPSPGPRRAPSPERRLRRTESLRPETLEAMTRLANSQSSGMTSSPSVPRRPPSPSPSVPHSDSESPGLQARRTRSGSMSMFDEHGKSAVATSAESVRSPSAPPLKRRREDDDDDDDMMLSLLAGKAGGKRRNSEPSPAPMSSLAKGKGKESSTVELRDAESATSKDSPSAVKKIKLSLKAGLGLGNGAKGLGSESLASSSPSPAQPPTTSVKDGDGG